MAHVRPGRKSATTVTTGPEVYTAFEEGEWATRGTSCSPPLGFVQHDACWTRSTRQFGGAIDVAAFARMRVSRSARILANAATSQNRARLIRQLTPARRGSNLARRVNTLRQNPICRCQ